MTETLATGLVAVLGMGALTLAAVVVKRDAALLLCGYLALLLLLPARLVLPGFGAIGGPATLYGLFLLLWWGSGVFVRGLGFVRASNLIRMAFFGMLGVYLVSYGLSPLRLRTALESSGADRDLITLLASAGVLLVAADGLRSKEQVHRVLNFFVTLMAIVAGIALIQVLFKWDPVQYMRLPGLIANDEIGTFKSRSAFLRPYSTTGHPIELAVLLSVAFPLALHFAMVKEKAPGSLYRWVRVGLILGGAFIAISRSGILGIAVGSIVLFFTWSWRARANAAVLGVLFLGAMQALVPGIVGTLVSLVAGASDDPSIHGRLEDFANIERMLPDTWLIGLGLGTWSVEEYFVLDNEFLRTLMEVGVVGLFALAFLIGMVVVTLSRAISQKSRDRNLLVTMLATVLVLVVSMLTFDALDFTQYRGVFYFLIGMYAGYLRLRKLGEPAPVPDLVPRRPIITVSTQPALESKPRAAIAAD